MIGEEGCRRVLEQALNLSESDGVEAYLSVQDLALTRFAGSSIHQNVNHGNAQLHIRAVTGRRQGRATTNDLSDGGIAKAVQAARANARLMPEDPDFHGLPSPEAPSGVSVYDQATAG